ncbi:MAG: helix-turn-helix domain-containing protein [Candidatus Cybelea sp.]
MNRTKPSKTPAPYGRLYGLWGKLLRGCGADVKHVHTFYEIARYARVIDGKLVAWPKQETLAADLGVTMKTIQRREKWLESAGLFKIEQKRQPDGGYGSNRYEIAVDGLVAVGHPQAQTCPTNIHRERTITYVHA